MIFEQDEELSLTFPVCISPLLLKSTQSLLSPTIVKMGEVRAEIAFCGTMGVYAWHGDVQS
jgi:hypothetical protein